MVNTPTGCRLNLTPSRDLWRPCRPCSQRLHTPIPRFQSRSSLLQLEPLHNRRSSRDDQLRTGQYLVFDLRHSHPMGLLSPCVAAHDAGSVLHFFGNLSVSLLPQINKNYYKTLVESSEWRQNGYAHHRIVRWTESPFLPLTLPTFPPLYSRPTVEVYQIPMTDSYAAPRSW